MENVDHVDSKDDRMWAFIAHLLGFALFFFPFGNIIGPLVILLIKGEQSGFVKDQAKEALNFQISMEIYLIVSALLCFVLIGFPIFAGFLIFDVIVMIVAAVAANEGKAYRYPLCVRFMS